MENMKDISERNNLTDKEIAEIKVLGMEIAKSTIEEDKKVRFFQFFAEMVRDFGDVIRPFVKSMYLAASAEVSDDLFEEMDDAETVRKYDVNTKFGDFVYEKMLNITYPSYGRTYPSLGLSISEKRYLENPDEYKKLTTEIVESIIAENGIEQELEEEWGYNSWTIAELVWQEMVDQGLESTVIEEWDDDDIEDEIYRQNLPEDEQEEMLEERKAHMVDVFLTILKKERHYHD